MGGGGLPVKINIQICFIINANGLKSTFKQIKQIFNGNPLRIYVALATITD